SWMRYPSEAAAPATRPVLSIAPYGGRNRSQPTATPRWISERIAALDSFDRSGCEYVWLQTRWPAASSDGTSHGNWSRHWPVGKKMAVRARSASADMMAWMASAPAQSSNVSVNGTVAAGGGHTVEKSKPPWATR